MRKKRVFKRFHRRQQNSRWKLSFFLVLLLSGGFILFYYGQDNAHSESTSMQAAEMSTIHSIKSITVNISEQKLYLYEGDQEVKSYPISSSKYGIGSAAGSRKTPLGRHRIVQKIGAGAPEGIVFKGRVNTGAFAEINGKNVGDLVTSRILWLEGLEEGKNRGKGVDSYSRYIYIHGTAEENLIGQPASHGCIRMKNSDVIDLFDEVDEGTLVDIKL